MKFKTIISEPLHSLSSFLSRRRRRATPAEISGMTLLTTAAASHAAAEIRSRAVAGKARAAAALLCGAKPADVAALVGADAGAGELVNGPPLTAGDLARMRDDLDWRENQPGQSVRS